MLVEVILGMRELCLFLCCICFLGASSQTGKTTTDIKAHLDSINRLIDRSVVRKDTTVLKTLYADDFHFLHSTGKVDDKASWLQSVSNANNVMASREHDTVDVELHGDLALVAGTLTVRFPLNSGRNAYAIRYIRLYALRKKSWQLLSHRSTAEWRF